MLTHLLSEDVHSQQNFAGAASTVLMVVYVFRVVEAEHLYVVPEHRHIAVLLLLVFAVLGRIIVTAVQYVTLPQDRGLPAHLVAIQTCAEDLVVQHS
jgi:hypothetical protein